jgi:Mg-chelatase subunit ChlD
VENGQNGCDPSSGESGEGDGLDDSGSGRDGSDEDPSDVEGPGDEVESDVNSGDGRESSPLDTETGNQADDESAEYTDTDDTDPWATPALPEIDHEAVLDDAFNAPSVAADSQTEAPLGHGDPSDIAEALKLILGHDFMDKMAGGDISDITGSPEGRELSPENADKLSMAIFQALSFDSASRIIAGVELIKWPKNVYGHTWRRASEETVDRYMPEAGSMSRAMLIGRRAFEDNRKAKINQNKTSGRIKPGVLGRRAPIGDDRLFGSKEVPKKRSYKVIICVDCSGSMGSGDRMRKIKRIVFMQAELLHGLGIPFEIFGYSGGASTTGQFKDGYGSSQDVVYIHQVKEMGETWSNIPKSKLAGLEPVGANLDGHTMEYARKRLQRHMSNTTDPILVYFTDGDMPMENYSEERNILERETDMMRRMGITALGVGLHTSSPSKYGLETVQVDSDADIVKVVEQLERALTEKRKARR